MVKDNNQAIGADALKLIFERNLEAHFVAKKLLLASIISSLAGVVGVIFFIYAIFFQPIKHVYLAVTPDMKIMQIIPLKQAYYTDSTAGNFALRSIVKAFNFSYINRKHHFRQLLNEGFSEAGLSRLVGSMKNSGIMDRIIKQKLFVSFAATTAPFVIQKGVIINPFTRKPTYQWVIQFRGVMTYTNGSEEATKINDYNVTVTRVSSLNAGDALRIKSIVARNITGHPSGADND